MKAEIKPIFYFAVPESQFIVFEWTTQVVPKYIAPTDSENTDNV